jgi:four helix bundle protein
MRPHHGLEAWSKSVDLVTDVYRGTEHFPKEERCGLTSPIRRAAVSIAANIAEGAGRHSRKEFAYFLSNAQGSASELETELIIGHRLGYLDERTFSALRNSSALVGSSQGYRSFDAVQFDHLPFTFNHLRAQWPSN